jgi:hypothetical protein
MSRRALALTGLAIWACEVVACGGGASSSKIDKTDLSPDAADDPAAAGGASRDIAPGERLVDGGIDALAPEPQDRDQPSSEVVSDGSAESSDATNLDGPASAGSLDVLPDVAEDRAAAPSPDGATPPDAPGGEVTTPAPACSACASYGMPTQIGRVTVAALNNLSGIAVSKRNAGILYVHNDLTRPEFFALSESAALRATFTFPATTVVDMEDIAVAHCPAGSCVYLADTGDNNSVRTSYAIVRTPEPQVNLDPAATPTTTTVIAEKLTFTYPDGSHNAESLLVDPASDTLYVITKLNSLPSTVYRLPATFGGPALVAQKVTTLTVPRMADGPATGASAHPCGAGFLLRTNTVLYEFRIPAGSPFEGAFDAVPVSAPLAVEVKGEGVAYRAEGRGYFTTSEGAMPPINQVGCP